MNQIIIASHGKLAEGMKKTVEFFGGSNIEVLEQTLENSNFEKKVINLLEENKGKNCLVFTDLLGGSVNQIFTRNLKSYPFHLITGMNLAVILECIFAQEDIDENFIRNAIENSKAQFCYMNDVIKNMKQDDD